MQTTSKRSFVSHDLGLVQNWLIGGGDVPRMVEENETQSIFNPQHPYVKALIACRPTPESPKDHLPTVEDFIGDGAGTPTYSPVHPLQQKI